MRQKELAIIGETLKILPLTGAEAPKTKPEGAETNSVSCLSAYCSTWAKGNGRNCFGLKSRMGKLSKITIKNQEKDYILKVSHVLALKLRARVVVLSCCHSIRGEVKPELGCGSVVLLGLSWLLVVVLF